MEFNLFAVLLEKLRLLEHTSFTSASRKYKTESIVSTEIFNFL
jgi:hypothetical protein